MADGIKSAVRGLGLGGGEKTTTREPSQTRAEKRRLIESILAELAPADAGARPLVPRIGAAYYPEDGAYAEDLLATADLRLNAARRG